MLLKGNVRMPIKLSEAIKRCKTLSDSVMVSDLPNFDCEQNAQSYLDFFRRKVDPLLVCVFYGLYESMELPPLRNEPYENENLNGTYEFGVKLDNEIAALRDIMLLLWVSGNEPIGESLEAEYREKLYSFLRNLLDDGYMSNVVFPFYVCKADAGEPSFIDKMIASSYVEWKMRSQSPEYISLDFTKKRSEFQNELEGRLKDVVNT